MQRDFSITLKEHEKAKAMAKMMSEVQKSYCLGPFDECPFPNKCKKQAFICQISSDQSIGFLKAKRLV